MAAKSDALAEALKALTEELAKLNGQLLALKLYVAAIPGARETPLQGIRNAVPQVAEDKSAMAAAVHKALDDLDWLSQHFAELRRASR